MRTPLLVTLSALGLLASARAGDPPPFGVAIGEPACGPVLIPQDVYHTVRVKMPVTETVLVAETIKKKVVRPVYRKVPGERLEPRPMLVPEKRQELRTRLTYQETRRQALETRLEYVPEKRDELQPRLVYRKTGQEPQTRLVYVAVKTQRVQTRMVYVEKRCQVTRMASRIRMVDATEIDPATGRGVRVQKPVCHQVPVVETVTTYVLEPRQSVETVTEYRLEPRTEPVDRYALSTEMAPTPVTRYRPEVRTAPREVKEYHLVQKTGVEDATHYRHELRLAPAPADYRLVWEEAVVEEKVYRYRTRTELREVQIVVQCQGEAVRPGR
jgi:hypothetical protein